MKPSRPSSIIRFAGCAGLLLALLSAGAPPAQAQAIQVESADPPVAAQGTVNLNVLIKGNGFERGAISRFFVAGTADPGGITVKTTTFFTSTELIVNIDVADAATIANFDIEVQNPNFRTGKGIELLTVLPPQPSTPGYVGFARQDYATGAGPAAVVSEDFNGDSVLDLATTNFGDNSVSVLLGNGDGTFGARTDFPTGLGPRGLVAADFNGDSRVDLATASNTDNSLSVLLGNGDGTFPAKMDFPSGTGPFAVVAADFNADGRTDLAAANQVADTVSLLLGNGDGTFGAKMDFPTNTEPMSIVAADFNGDGKLDVATSNRMANTVSVLLGNGDGTFGGKADFPTGSGPRSLSVVDFNLDGRLDLATANHTSNQGSNTASVLLSQGNGTFDPRIDLSTTAGPIAVSARDFDNDGRPDLATANSERFFCSFFALCFRPSLSLHLGNGDGTFRNQLFFVVGSTTVIRMSPPWPLRASGVAMDDFNADGRVDLAVTDSVLNLVRVVLQAPALSVDPVVLPFSNFQLVGVPTAPMDVTISSTGSFPAVFGAASISGTDAGDFSIIADNCSGATVPAGSSCVVSVMFNPSSLGAKSASLTIPNNTSGNPHVANLRGGGAPNAPVADLSPATVNVADVLVGFSLTNTVTTLQNIGGVTLNVSSITIMGANANNFSLSPGTGSCTLGGAFTLAPGATCGLIVAFTPSAVGSRIANIVITSDSAGSPHMVAISGNGVNLSITPDSPSRTVRAGQTAFFELHFAAGNASGGAGAATVTLTCSHSIPAATCTVGPTSLPIPGSANVTVSTTARALLPPLGSRRRLPPVGQPELYPLVMAWLTLTLAIFLAGWRRPMRLRLSAAAVATVVLSVALWSGCGGGGSTRGTPPGTYKVTVSANAGAGTQAQSRQLTVTVQ